MRVTGQLRWCVPWVMLLVFCTPGARAYSLLTHEQLIDLTWDASIVPLLRSRYPMLTDAQIEHARAYAYGGCVIQDIGYYPFGDPRFSNLTHYVRSGDFVVALFRNAGDANELAFAVGALSHYIGDTVGHANATNLAVPVEFPKLRARYGDRVSYAEGERQHVQTEFAFDIDQIAHHRFAPVHYLRHVGLEVPTRQLGMAFYQTYGVAEDGGAGQRINVRGYRFAVRAFLPRIAYAVTLLHRGHEPAEVENGEWQRLEREVAVVSARNRWDEYRKKPGIGTHLLAGLLWVLPKVGAIKLVAVKGPTEATEEAYVHSVLQAEDALNRALQRFTPPTEPLDSGASAQDFAPRLPVRGTVMQDGPRLGSGLVAWSAPAGAGAVDAGADGAGAKSEARMVGEAGTAGMARVVGRVREARLAGEGRSCGARVEEDPRHPLPNRDLDTGAVTQPAGYRLTDETYAGLLHRLVTTRGALLGVGTLQERDVPPGVKAEILLYYADLSLPFATKRKPGRWAAVQRDLVTLRGLPAREEDAVFATFDKDAPVP